MRTLTTIVVFLVSLAVCGLVFGLLGVPFHTVATLAGAVVMTWVVRQAVFATVARWRRNAE